MTTTFTLARDSFARLTLTNDAGQVFHGVAPVRAFPVQAPEDGIALVSTDGKEVAWIDSLDDLAPDQALLVREELGGR